mgnify:CR=1 FL=1
MEYILPVFFLFISFIYSSVGLGGGSSYTAILAIMGISYKLIPTTSLTLNLVVTFIGMVNFWRKGHGRISLVAPFLITSIPMAYIAGALIFPEIIFQFILTTTLVLVAIRIFIFRDLAIKYELSIIQRWILTFCLGIILGFIAGAVGIGGGIYLVPLIILFGLGTTKEASAAGAMFIWANSMAGLIARYQYGTLEINFILPLIIAVIVGGFIGSYYGSVKYDTKTIQKIMGGIIIFAIILLIQRML